jgi:hypothetical protein
MQEVNEIIEIAKQYAQIINDLNAIAGIDEISL